MRIAVVGSRTFPATKAQFDAMSATRQQETLDAGQAMVLSVLERALHTGDSVVSGAAAGPDSWGVEAAEGLGFPTTEFPAAWRRPDGSTNRGAGFERNSTIVANADGVLAFYDGQSRGTLDTINKAKAAGKPVRVMDPTGAWSGNDDIPWRKA